VDLVVRLDRSRFEPVVCCLASGDELVERLRTAGIRVEIIGLHKPGKRSGSLPRYLADTLGRLWRFVRVVRAERPDVVHGMLFWAYTFAALAGRAAGVPVIVASRRSLANFKRGKPHYVWLERIANRLTHVFVANSAAVRDDVLAQENLSPSRVRVIYNGIDSAAYQVPPGDGLRASLGLTAGRPVAIVVANFIPYKGHAIFLDAWRRLLDVHPNAVALLVGEGPARKTCEARAEELGMTGSLRFLGTRHDVPALLALADVAVHPSLEEGFSNAILEAMAAGRPLVATAVGGNPEAVRDGVSGRIVPPADADALYAAVRELFDDPARAAAMGLEGQRIVARTFSMAATVKAYEALYSELAGRTPAGVT
jgi:glycosyltransferase involved in cell wall biosynthesis